MISIKHRVVCEATPQELFQALTETQGLSRWWAPADADSANAVGSNIEFKFGPNGEHVVAMQVAELEEASKVVWNCTAGPWESTTAFTFLIEPDPRGAALIFDNSGWGEQDDFYAHCNAKWGFFLTVSFKNYVESGLGMPHPADPSI